MGNLVSTVGAVRANVTGIQSFVAELPATEYVERWAKADHSLGSSRFLKTLRCTQPLGSVVVKIFVKHDPEISLDPYLQDLAAIRKSLEGIPNVLAYEQFLETEKAGYVIRQYLHSSLYDRISTTPFLTPFEKTWIAFQLISAVSEAHSRDVIEL